MNSLEHYTLGRKLLEEGDFENGINNLLQSIEISPHFKTLEIIGCAYLDKKMYSRAIVYLAAAAALNKQIRSKSYLSKALLESGDYVDARRQAEEVLSIEKNNKIAKEVVEKAKIIEANEAG